MVKTMLHMLENALDVVLITGSGIALGLSLGSDYYSENKTAFDIRSIIWCSG